MMKKGQIWIETVLYTLIGLTLMAVILAIALPKINESKDRIIVEQTIESLKVFDAKITEVLDKGGGNIRKIETFTMKKGELIINSSGDSVIFYIDELTKPYSQPGAEIELGRIKLITTEGQKKSSVSLRLDYSGIANLTFSGTEQEKKLAATSVPYSFSFENRGISGTLSNIDITQG